MARTSRPAREARALLAEHKAAEPPVNVRAIAKQFAQIAGRDLPDEISGMLVPVEPSGAQKGWVIFYNRNHVLVRQRFTIAHELAHIRLHAFTAPHADRGFKVRFRADEMHDRNVLEEVEANQFAAELLMPSTLVLRKAAALRLDYGDPDDATLAELASTFKVSKLAMSIRVADLARGVST